MKIISSIISTLVFAQAQAQTTLISYVYQAHGKIASVYGYSEKSCGDSHRPVRCSENAVTASGQRFDPELPTAAISLPKKKRMPAEGMLVWLRTETSKCVEVLVNDKKNSRYLGKSPLDLSKGALEALIGDSHSRFWSGKVFVCSVAEVKKLQESVFVSLFVDQIVIPNMSVN